MLLNAKRYFLLLLLLCIVLLALPIFLRDKYTNGFFIDQETYNNLRLSDDLKQNGFVGYDKLSYGGREFIGEKAWLYLLSFSPYFMTKYLPFLLGILSFIIFYLLISKLRPEFKGLASLMLIISPGFLYYFSISTKYLAALLFILFGIYFFVKDRKLLSYIFFFIGGLFSVFSLLLVFLGFLFISLKKRSNLNLLVIFLLLVIDFLISFYNVFKIGLPESLFAFNDFTFSKFFSFLFSELGGNFGLSIFMFVLALLGIYYVYNDKYKHILYYLLLVLLLFASFYLPFLILYLTFVIAFFAAAGMTFFFRSKWKSGELRFLTILIVCCSLLFSLLVFYTQVPDFEPTKQQGGAMVFLKNQKISPVTFVHPEEGGFVLYANKATFLDKNILYAPRLKERELDYYNLLEATNLTDVIYVFNKYNMEYIWIDSKILDYYAIEGSGGRLLFFLKYSPNKFVNIFSDGEVNIWWYDRAAL